MTTRLRHLTVTPIPPGVVVYTAVMTDHTMWQLMIGAEGVEKRWHQLPPIPVASRPVSSARPPRKRVAR